MPKIADLTPVPAPDGTETVVILKDGVAKRTGLGTIVAAAISSLVATAIAAANATLNALVDAATVARDAALGHAGTATTKAAEAAASAAIAAGLTALYPTTAAGLADVAEGEYFTVPGDGPTYATLYRKVAGAASAINTYPTKAALDTAVSAAAASAAAAAAAAIAAGIWPSSAAAYVPQGAASFSYAGGSGGTNSVNNLATFTGGTLASNPVIYFDVVGGVMGQPRMVFPGLYIGSGTPTMPTVVLPNTAGGASITLAVGKLYANGQRYWAQGSDYFSINPYVVTAGAPVLATDLEAFPTNYGVRRFPGVPSWSRAFSDGVDWIYFDPYNFKHLVIDQLVLMTGGLPLFAKALGAPRLQMAYDDGVMWLDIGPGRDEFRHAALDDFRRRQYRLEIAQQRDVQWEALRPCADILLLPSTGQSRSRGHASTYGNSTTVFSGAALAPPLGLMFTGGVRPDDTSTDMAVSMAGFVQLVETFCASSANGADASDGETWHAGMIAMIGQLLRDENDIDLATYSRRFLAYSVGRGGVPIENIVPSNDTYGRHALLKTGVTKALAAGVTAGKSIQIPGLNISQGESNGATYLTWPGKVDEIIADAQAHAQATLGGTRPLFTLVEQISSHPTGTPSFALACAQVDMAFSRLYVNVFPSHMIQRVAISDLHDSGRGSYEKGAYAGWLWKRLLWDQVKVLPLKPTVEVQGKLVIFRWPDLGFGRTMMADIVNVPAQANYGLTISNGAGVAQTISTSRLVGRDFIAELAATPSAGWKFQFGKTGNAQLGLCNLCDDTPITVEATGRPIRRYVPLCEGTIL